MAEKQIFQEMQGIFSWLEMQQNHSSFDMTGKTEEDRLKYNEEKTYCQLNEFFNFLKLDINHEEIEALNELVNPGRHTDKVTFEKFYQVFIKTAEEQEKENNDLKEAFKNITLDKNEQTISLKRLKDVSSIYDKKYRNSMEKILGDLEQNYAQDGQLDYIRFIDEQFPLEK